VLRDDEALRDLVKREQIQDVLLVVTYQGRTPDWPAWHRAGRHRTRSRDGPGAAPALFFDSSTSMPLDDGTR